MGLKIFSSKSCPECLVAKNYLLALGADFEEVMVDNPEIVAYVEKKTGMRKVPVIENGEGFVVGFKPDQIKKLIS